MTKRRLFGLPLPWGVAVYLLLPTVFLCLLTVGIYGDFKHWWSELPYATNMLTAFTGACIGIPFAVGVIQQLTRRQANDADWSTTVRLLNDSISQISEAITETYSGDLDELESFASLLGFCQDRSIQLIVYADTFFINNSDGTKTYRFSKLLSREAGRFTTDLDELRVAATLLLSKSTSASSITLSAMYTSAWESLDAHVRPRVLEITRKWLPRDSYLRLRQQGGFRWIENLDLVSAVNILIEYFRMVTLEEDLVASPEFVNAQTSLRAARENINGYLVVRRELTEIEALKQLASYR